MFVWGVYYLIPVFPSLVIVDVGGEKTPVTAYGPLICVPSRLFSDFSVFFLCFFPCSPSLSSVLNILWIRSSPVFCLFANLLNKSWSINISLHHLTISRDSFFIPADRTLAAQVTCLLLVVSHEPDLHIVLFDKINEKCTELFHLSSGTQEKNQSLLLPLLSIQYKP